MKPEVHIGMLVRLTAESGRAMPWRFRIPQRVADAARFAAGVILSKPDAHGLVTVECTLAEGITRLV
jgi:hypothetical protein